MKGGDKMKITDEIIQLNGHELLLRNPREEDAELLIQSLKDRSGETRFLVMEPEEIALTIEEECEFINRQNESDSNIMILAFLDGEFVGNCSLNGFGASRYKHRVSFAIALYQKYVGMGIGTILTEKAIQVAKEKGFEQMELEVVASNERAIGLYKKMGFEIYGTLPNNMKYKDGTYADTYWMMKKF